MEGVVGTPGAVTTPEPASPSPTARPPPSSRTPAQRNLPSGGEAGVAGVPDLGRAPADREPPLSHGGSACAVRRPPLVVLPCAGCQRRPASSRSSSGLSPASPLGGGPLIGDIDGAPLLAVGILLDGHVDLSSCPPPLPPRAAALLPAAPFLLISPASGFARGLTVSLPCQIAFDPNR
jgi:hypothetical protein